MTNHERGLELQEKYIDVARRLLDVVGDKPLPPAKEVRSETDVPPEYMAADIAALQKILAELDAGRRDDRSPAEAGMQTGYTAALQGGLGWKIDAELEAILANSELKHGPIVLMASEYRLVTEKERQFAATKGITLQEGATERDLAIALTSIRPGYVDGENEPVNFTYDPSELAEGYVFNIEKNKGAHKPTVVKIGIINGEPVYVMQVLRAFNMAGEYKQPSTLEMMPLVAALIQSQQGEQPNFLGNVGSSIYPSLDVAPKGNQIFAESGIPTVLGDIKYGTKTLAVVKNELETPISAANTFSEVDRLTQMAARL